MVYVTEQETEYVETGIGRLPIIYRPLTAAERRSPQWVVNDNDGERLLLSTNGQSVVMSLTSEIGLDGNIVNKDGEELALIERGAEEAPTFLEKHWQGVAAAGAILALTIAVNYHVKFSAAPKTSAEFNQGADVIAVLTGGAGKIPRALELCSENQYLFISGCSPAASPIDILSANRYDSAKHTPHENIKFGYNAINTTGNAKEICNFLEAPENEWIDEVVIATYSSHTARANEALEDELAKRPELAKRVTFKWECVGGNSPWQGPYAKEALKTAAASVGLDSIGSHMRHDKPDIRSAILTPQ